MSTLSPLPPLPVLVENLGLKVGKLANSRVFGCECTNSLDICIKNGIILY
jgi:hypothetical protein